MKSILLFLLFLLLLSSNSSYSLWLSKDEFMQQYSTKLLSNFPRDTNRRAAMKQRCESITSNTIPQSKDIIQWREYNHIHKSPNQSALAYLACYPYLDSSSIQDRFNKKLIWSFKTTTYADLIAGFDSKACPVTTSSNNLNDCNLFQVVTDLAAIVLNDLSNIRQATSRWYVSEEYDSRVAFISQYFTATSEQTAIKRIEQGNTILCDTPQIPYLGWVVSQRCGFPQTHASFIQTSNQSKTILDQTQAINGDKLLLYDCDVLDTGSNILWCGITDHRNTQSYVSMIYNELWFYEQFAAMYSSTSSLSTSFLVGNQVGLSQASINQLRNQVSARANYHTQKFNDAAQVSVNLISQLEASYTIHLWLMAVNEASARAVTTYIKPRQESIRLYMKGRLNTQAKSSTNKGT